ncbi:uncharacterized protein LOC106151101 [Lingula anatina]|uniref:Uncharacterized protein LOC106151101 n=1 Tax=Lingula anatina TaxID=7574 RepID=A0A1S3H0W5_LINAN|nr:uncharacterized protein LOC106151101 [Lingula anatina]|eukprot:XP_013379648.1 uncharacterized protein LOC106151101 [Lingula anatina]
MLYQLTAKIAKVIRIMDNTETAGGCAFSISVDEDQPRAKIPKRLQERAQNKKKVHSKEEIDEKQRKADERRTAHSKEKIQRMKENQEQCLKINQKVQVLIQQDAKRRGAPGTEHIRPISSKEAVSLIRSVASDMGKITQGLNEDVHKATSSSL